jgi:RNA polymerase sigma-70 factor (ECF subfamily)
VRRELEKIYRRHRQGLFTLAVSITGEPASAEDAVQEAFAHLCRGNAPTHAGYAFAAVRNAAIDQLRRRGRKEAALAGAAVFNGSPADPATAAADAELAALLRRAVAELDEKDREVVVMRIYANLTFEQIGVALGEPLPTVASRYRRAVRKLESRCRRLT